MFLKEPKCFKLKSFIETTDRWSLLQATSGGAVTSFPFDSQVVLVDEDKEAVEGQQADGTPCGMTHRAPHGHYCHS